MGIWSLLTGGVTSLVGKYFDNKKAESDAKHQRKLTTIGQKGVWETTAAVAMAKSFKDEYLMLIFTLPLIAIFISPFVDLYMLGEYTQGCLQVAAMEGLQGLSKTPDWYTYIIGIMVSTSYGVKGAELVLNKLKNKGK